MVSADQLLTVAEVAAELRCEPRTVRRMIARGDLPVVRINQRMQRVRRQDLDGLTQARLRRAGAATGPWGAGATYPAGSRWWDR